MSKFNVGDRVKCVKASDKPEVINKIGTVIECMDTTLCVEFDDHIYGHGNGNSKIKGKYGHCWWFIDEEIELIKDTSKIVITTDGNTTLARLYEGNIVVKSAEAKCSPSDTYDFKVGAKIAFDRLMQDKPIVDKPKYKVGDKARIVDDTCNHEFKIGTIITLEAMGERWAMECNRPAWGIVGSYNYISERDIEPYTEPVNDEVLKLYCIKSYKYWVTKGKVYEYVNGKITNYDNNFIASEAYKSWDIYKQKNPIFASCLVPLVKRPAKVGEWVYIEKANPLHEPASYKTGDIFKTKSDHACAAHDIYVKGADEWIDYSEYLVLDGYQPEPEYYSGKAVCIEHVGIYSLTKNKTYVFKNGKLILDSGYEMILKCKNLSEINKELSAYFVELKE